MTLYRRLSALSTPAVEAVARVPVVCQRTQLERRAAQQVLADRRKGPGPTHKERLYRKAGGV